MDTDLAYYRRRLAEERAAAHYATHPIVCAAHRDLAREYELRIAAMEAGNGAASIHLVPAP